MNTDAERDFLLQIWYASIVKQISHLVAYPNFVIITLLLLFFAIENATVIWKQQILLRLKELDTYTVITSLLILNYHK